MNEIVEGFLNMKMPHHKIALLELCILITNALNHESTKLFSVANLKWLSITLNHTKTFN